MASTYATQAEKPNRTEKNKYLDASGHWTVPAGGGGGSSTLAGLDDVNIENPTDGQTLRYNSTTQKFENADGASADIPEYTYSYWLEHRAELEATGKPFLVTNAPASPDLVAENIGYDNSTSGLTATNVQDAIDEVNGNLVYGTGISTGGIPYTDGSAKFYRRGNIVNVIFAAKITVSGSGWKTLVTIPNNMPKPKYSATFIFYAGGFVNNGDINTDGLIRLSWPAGASVSSSWCFFNFMYLI